MAVKAQSTVSNPNSEAGTINKDGGATMRAQIRGVNDNVAKPIITSHLAARVQAALRRAARHAGWRADVHGAPSTGPAASAGAHTDVSHQTLRVLVEDALRKLNTPSALAEHELLRWLPHVVAAAPAPAGEPAPHRGRTPLEQAAALRQVLIESIDKLKPPGGAAKDAASGALQYVILREEYVEGRLNKHIMARHNLSQGTFNRARRQAIAALARELCCLERLLRAADVPVPVPGRRGQPVLAPMATVFARVGSSSSGAAARPDPTLTGV